MSFQEALLWASVGGLSFYTAYASAATSYVVVVYLFALVHLSRTKTWRKAFYSGLAVGLIIAIGKLEFFWRIFGAGALALWLVFAIWVALFVVSGHLSFARFGPRWACLLLPFLWCGLEYFRSELYYLRFSWLTPGLAFDSNPTSVPLASIGSYGIGFVLMAIASVSILIWRTSRHAAFLSLLVGVLGLRAWGWIGGLVWKAQPVSFLQVAGVQLEFPTDNQVCAWLREVVRRYPQARLIVLSEYTFTGPIPQSLKAWCREQKRFLIVGAKDPASGGSFYNTAFVISPTGEIVFRQGKSVPIQFFNDGLPAKEQTVWRSPWGAIGICICYDLSYTRVTDRLVRQGAQMLIIPTMDVEDWGKQEHQLHRRVAPVRAAEYRIPIFRLASSGISQAVDASGHICASAPYPGAGAILAARFGIGAKGRLPLDRWLAPCSSGVTGIVVLCLAAQAYAAKLKIKVEPAC